MKFKSLVKFRKGSEPYGHFCQTCEIICDTDEHKAHVLTKFSRADLATPTKILEAKSENKKEAQYFFTPQTMEYLKETLQRLGITHVLCIGTPTLFENLPDNMEKLLLDIDSRYLGKLHQFIQ